MFNWLANRRITKLNIRLAGNRAQLASEYQMAEESGTLYPIVVAQLVNQIAADKEELRLLTKKRSDRYSVRLAANQARLNAVMEMARRTGKIYQSQVEDLHSEIARDTAILATIK